MDTASFSFPPAGDVPHAGRRALRDALVRWHVDDLTDAVELVASELLGNVSRHAHSEVRMDLVHDADTVRVEIADGSSIVPAIIDLAECDDGVGLRVLANVAADWGVRRRASGKAVWFTISQRGGTSSEKS